MKKSLISIGLVFALAASACDTGKYSTAPLQLTVAPKVQSIVTWDFSDCGLNLLEDLFRVNYSGGRQGLTIRAFDLTLGTEIPAQVDSGNGQANTTVSFRPPGNIAGHVITLTFDIKGSVPKFVAVFQTPLVIR